MFLDGDGWGGFWAAPQSFGTANWDDLLEMIRKSADSSNPYHTSYLSISILNMIHNDHSLQAPGLAEFLSAVLCRTHRSGCRWWRQSDSPFPSPVPTSCCTQACWDQCLENWVISCRRAQHFLCFLMCLPLSLVEVSFRNQQSGFAKKKATWSKEV